MNSQIFKTLVLSTALLTGTVTHTIAQDNKEIWKNGWVAESYFAPVGGDLEGPNDYPVDRWLDQGNGLFSTDYLYAFDGSRTYLYNAGTLRSGSINIDKPGDYRLHLFTDRYWSAGQPVCDVKLALDGSTVIDASTEFTSIETKIPEKKMISAAQKFRESSTTISPVFEVSEPGYYRIDFWSYCRDTNDKDAIYKLSNQMGNMQTNQKFFFWNYESPLKIFYQDDPVVKDGVQLRFNISSLKSNIANSSGTVFDLALENIETGKKGRITEDSIWHLASATPEKDILRNTVLSSSELSRGDWEFVGVRGDKSFIWTQEIGNLSWKQAFVNMPFVPEFMEARKSISLKEDGIYGIAIGYDPKSVLNTKEPSIPVFEQTTVFIEKKSSDGSVRRLKIFDDALQGTQSVGEVTFINVRLPAGDYDIIFLRDPSSYGAQTTRYGNLTKEAILSENSNLSIRIKEPSSNNYKILR